jgi:hypothetical protein
VTGLGRLFKSVSRSVVELRQTNLSSLVDGDGSAVITQSQVVAIKTFLANLSAAGSADLQQLIATELQVGLVFQIKFATM